MKHGGALWLFFFTIGPMTHNPTEKCYLNIEDNFPLVDDYRNISLWYGNLYRSIEISNLTSFHLSPPTREQNYILWFFRALHMKYYLVMNFWTKSWNTERFSFWKSVSWLLNLVKTISSSKNSVQMIVWLVECSL